MPTTELAPVIVILETGSKYELLSFYWAGIVSQMNFNGIVKGKKDSMETSKLFSEVSSTTINQGHTHNDELPLRRRRQPDNVNT